MFKGAKKEDLRRIASKLELCVSDKLAVLDFMDLIKNYDRYKNDPDSVHELANLIIEERKYDESQQLEPKLSSERVIQPSSLGGGAERAGKKGILDESTFSEGVCVQTHKLHMADFERGVFFSGCRRSVYCNQLHKIEIHYTFNRDLFQNNSKLTINSRVNATIANRGNSYETNADFFVVPRITDMIPSQPFKNTVFGYIASGSIPVSSENKPHCGLIKDNVDLEKTMRRFWEIENVEPETVKNKETIICEEHFQKNHTRDSTGRYIVSMPFKKDPHCLGQSKDIALKKLNFLWNRLKREPNYLKLYRDFLKEYKELGHMQEVDEKEECGMYFIPLLGVYRSDKKNK
ncbi:integrase catalytic domain-containing protein [Trichonephila clavipes]|nr:integrase catalytic domain-containing protein [Trichonephila clavipes]